MYSLLPKENMALEEPNGDFPYLPSGAVEVNRMIKENGDLFSDALCKVCSAVLNSDSQKLAHYQSKKHANKVRRYMSIHKEEEPTIKRFKLPSGDSANSNEETDRSKACLICNMTFSSPVVAESHYQGKVHTKNLRLKTFGHQPPVALPQALAPVVKKKKTQLEEASNVASSGPAEDDQDHFCSICHASFNNPLMAKQHYEGKKHKKQLTQQKLMETYGPSTAPVSEGRKGATQHLSAPLKTSSLSTIIRLKPNLSRRTGALSTRTTSERLPVPPPLSNYHSSPATGVPQLGPGGFPDHTT
ncbi:zinc finger protein 346 isoform X2 [Oncorhynchus mykiss]|uniref:zinc finger protein 346 isoform X2 n=1 Tax=Oncorhynchus mykiss TaxID=8022 RepID=UPI001878D690|nr:zinc finger protein 346 isoform X2 [Oncorhynchus mykiss]